MFILISFECLLFTNLSVQPESIYQTKAISQCLPEGILELQLTGSNAELPVFICWGQEVQELETACGGRLLNYFLTKHILHRRGRGCFRSCSKCSLWAHCLWDSPCPLSQFSSSLMWVLFCLFVFFPMVLSKHSHQDPYKSCPWHACTKP